MRRRNFADVCLVIRDACKAGTRRQADLAETDELGGNENRKGRQTVQKWPFQICGMSGGESQKDTPFDCFPESGAHNEKERLTTGTPLCLATLCA